MEIYKNISYIYNYNFVFDAVLTSEGFLFSNYTVTANAAKSYLYCVTSSHSLVFMRKAALFGIQT